MFEYIHRSRLKRTAFIRSKPLIDCLSDSICAIVGISHARVVSALDIDIQQEGLVLIRPRRGIAFSRRGNEFINGPCKRARNVSRTVYVFVKDQSHTEF